jgi:hypothetical protein
MVAGATKSGEGTFGRVEVAGRWIVAVGREEADGDREFGASVEGEPLHPPNKALVSLDKRLFGFNGTEVMDNTVNDEAGAVGAGNGITFSEVVFIKEGFDLGSLGDGDGKAVIRCTLPDVTGTKEPGNITHKVDFKVLLDGLLEHAFNVIGGREVGKVVYVDAEVQGRLAGDQAVGEDAGIVFTGCEANGNKDVAEGGVPVMRTTTEAVEGLFEEPKFVGFAQGTAGGDGQ